MNWFTGLFNREAQARDVTNQQKVATISARIAAGDYNGDEFGKNIYGLLHELSRATNSTLSNVAALENIVRNPGQLEPEYVDQAMYEILNVAIFPAEHPRAEIHKRLETAHGLLRDGFGHVPEDSDPKNLSNVWHIGYLARQACVPEAHTSYSTDLWTAKRIKAWKQDGFGTQGLNILTDLITTGNTKPMETRHAIDYIGSLGSTDGNYAQGARALAKVTDYLAAREGGIKPDEAVDLRKAAREIIQYAARPRDLINAGGSFYGMDLRAAFKAASFQAAIGTDAHLLAVVAAVVEFSPRAKFIDELVRARVAAGFRESTMRLIAD